MKEKIKQFWLDHPCEIIAAGTGAILITTCAILGVKYKRGDKAARTVINDLFKKPRGARTLTEIVDEQIFTDLAPEIEKAVLDGFHGTGYTKVIERTYETGLQLWKNVTVTIEEFSD